MIALVALAGCAGEHGETPVAGPSAAAAGGSDDSDAGGQGGAGGEGETAGSGGVESGGPTPNQEPPCDNGSCWSAPGLTPHCGGVEVDEDFGTGKYNVHVYPLQAPAGVAVQLKLDRTDGSWSPALLLADDAGVILHDGEVAASSDALHVEVLATGKGSSSAEVRVTATEDTLLQLFVSAWSVVQSDFTAPMPLDARYALGISRECPPGSATCPLPPSSITTFGSGYFTPEDSNDPDSPNYSPYKRDSRDEHSGYDLHAPLGTPVFATQSGTIVSASTTNTGLCGKSINLAADSGVTFRYCHLDQVLVTSGHVEAGEVIGHNGKTGNAKAAHVHFVYLDAPNVTGSGTAAQKSEKVNAYVDGLCK